MNKGYMITGLLIVAALQTTGSLAAEAKMTDSSAGSSDDFSIQDPYEAYNRKTFAFNDALDRNILQPVARFYTKIVPKPLNQGIHNFFLNLNTVSTVADDFLQFNFYQMTNDAWRLVINSTIGIGGLFDVASRMNLKFYQNDFGLTLANWGYRKSNYLILPFYGSYTFRDALALPVDYYALSAYTYIRPPRLGYAIYALGVIDWRAQTLKYNDLMDAAALDKYVFVRNAYMQRRAYQVEENLHLSIYNRDHFFSTSTALKEQKPGAPGSASNIDETTNIGQPASKPAEVTVQPG